jgi:hypothetical protein
VPRRCEKATITTQKEKQYVKEGEVEEERSKYAFMYAFSTDEIKLRFFNVDSGRSLALSTSNPPGIAT